MTKEYGGYFYILASRRNGTLYTGVTNNIVRRVWEHKSKKGSVFTEKYDVAKLVYCEHIDRIEDAIAREKQIKNWLRAWKIALIEKENPEWRDLYEEWFANPVKENRSL